MLENGVTAVHRSKNVAKRSLKKYLEEAQYKKLLKKWLLKEEHSATLKKLRDRKLYNPALKVRLTEVLKFCRIDY